jgi:hypothetical protein
VGVPFHGASKIAPGIFKIKRIANRLQIATKSSQQNGGIGL